MDYIVINKLITKSIYKQISDSISEAIDSGKLSYNDKLPTEKEICQMFSISQTVVKMAYEQLINEGKIIRIKGKGTYVTNRASYHTGLQSFYELETDPNVMRKTILLERSDKNLSAMRELALSSEQFYFHVISVLCKNENPLLKQEVFLPKHKYPNFLEEFDSTMDIYSFIEKKYGYKVKELRSTFSAINASSSDALLLEIDNDAAIYLVRARIIDSQEEVIGYVCNYYPGDFTEIEVTVHAI